MVYDWASVTSGLCPNQAFSLVWAVLRTFCVWHSVLRLQLTRCWRTTTRRYLINYSHPIVVSYPTQKAPQFDLHYYRTTLMSIEMTIRTMKTCDALSPSQCRYWMLDILFTTIHRLQCLRRMAKTTDDLVSVASNQSPSWT